MIEVWNNEWNAGNDCKGWVVDTVVAEGMSVGEVGELYLTDDDGVTVAVYSIWNAAFKVADSE
jgi:hypothetical protein